MSRSICHCYVIQKHGPSVFQALRPIRHVLLFYCSHLFHRDRKKEILRPLFKSTKSTGKVLEYNFRQDGPGQDKYSSFNNWDQGEYPHQVYYSIAEEMIISKF